MADDFNSFLKWASQQQGGSPYPAPGIYTSPIPGYSTGGMGGGMAPTPGRPWNVQPNGFVSRGGSTTPGLPGFHMPGTPHPVGMMMQNSINAARGGGPGGGMMGLNPMLLAALSRDINAMQTAADEQYNRFDTEVTRPFQEFMKTAPGQITQTGEQTAGGLRGLGDQAAGLGQQQYQEGAGFLADLFNQVMPQFDQVNQNLDQWGNDVTQRVNEADALAMEAVNWSKKAASEFSDRAAQDASAAASAIRRNAATMMKQITSSQKPDGTPWGPGERDAAIQQARGDVSGQVQEAITPLMSRYNEVEAQLKNQVGSMYGAAAGTKLQGAAILDDAFSKINQTKLAGVQAQGQFGLGVAEALNTFQQAARWGSEVQANLYGQAAQIQNAAVLNAVNLQMQGYQQTADFVASNPKHVISYLDGLMSIYAAQGAMSRPTVPGIGGASQRSREAMSESGGQRTSASGGSETQPGSQTGGVQTFTGEATGSPGREIPDPYGALDNMYLQLHDPRMGPPNPGATNWGWPR